MLDIKFIRDNPELVKTAIANKKGKVDIDTLLELDEKRRKLLTDINDLNQERNKAAKEKNIEKGKLIKENLVALQNEFRSIDETFQDMLLAVPNIPSSDTPVGPDESGNKVIKKVGELKEFSFQPKEHWQLGEELGVIDSEAAARVAGSRFTYLKGGLALMEFALVQLVMGIATDRASIANIINDEGLDLLSKPFIPVVPPVFIKPDVFQRMGRLEPKDERYYIQSDDQYLIGSAEHTLGPMHMDEVLKEEDLPIRYIGFSTAFRREAGSYGKDMKGILRVHQFDKLEMESFSLPEKSDDEQKLFVAIQERILRALNIPYQVVSICTGDMGSPDYRQIDIESWMPGQNRYRETHTSDLMTDYQSRRLNIKVKRTSGETQLVHMNDATASAIGRTLIAIMENYQREDGSIEIPASLRPYMFGLSEIRPLK